MRQANSPLGRPLKGKDRRVSVAVYVTGSTLDMITDYVSDRQTTQRAYSRSDFFNDALEKHITDLGLKDGGERQ